MDYTGEGKDLPSSPFMLVVLGPPRCLQVVVWGPCSPCMVLGARCRSWVVLLGAHGFSWVVFLGTCHFLWVEVLGLCHHSWLVVLAPHLPFGGLALIVFHGWRCRHSRVGVVGHHSCVQVLIVIHWHWFSVLFICHCRLPFVAICCLSVIAGCLLSIVSHWCHPLLFRVMMWWQAFPLGRGDVVGARHRVSWVGYDRGGIEELTVAIK